MKRKKERFAALDDTQEKLMEFREWGRGGWEIDNDLLFLAAKQLLKELSQLNLNLC